MRRFEGRFAGGLKGADNPVFSSFLPVTLPVLDPVCPSGSPDQNGLGLIFLLLHLLFYEQIAQFFRDFVFVHYQVDKTLRNRYCEFIKRLQLSLKRQRPSANETSEEV